jgi:hypothetical protein
MSKFVVLIQCTNLRVEYFHLNIFHLNVQVWCLAEASTPPAFELHTNTAQKLARTSENIFGTLLSWDQPLLFLRYAKIRLTRTECVLFSPYPHQQYATFIILIFKFKANALLTSLFRHRSFSTGQSVFTLYMTKLLLLNCEVMRFKIVHFTQDTQCSSLKQYEQRGHQTVTFDE